MMLPRKYILQRSGATLTKCLVGSQEVESGKEIGTGDEIENRTIEIEVLSEMSLSRFAMVEKRNKIKTLVYLIKAERK